LKSIINKKLRLLTSIISISLVLVLLLSIPTMIGMADAETVEVVENGSFETGFSSWTTQATAGQWRPWQVTGAGAGGYPSTSFAPAIAKTSPQDGQRVAWNGFTGYGPMEFRLWQDVTLPSGVATLSWMERIQKRFYMGGSNPYTFEVQIRDPNTNNTLSTIFSYSIDATSRTQVDTDWQSHSVDVSQFSGSTIRLYFVEQVPHRMLGPGQVEIDAVSLIVETNQAPDVSQAYASIECIWPPNHKMVDISIMGVTDPDGDPVTITITGITSDEATAAEEGAGGKNHSPDADGVGTNDATVRAERSGDGDGRVYEISFSASDGVGGVAEGSVKVGVPHDKSKKDCSAIDSGQNYDATATIIAEGW
jgi:hypothetical protein